MDSKVTAKIISTDQVAIPNTYQCHTASQKRSIAVLAHGITADRSEGGIFDRMADRLFEAGFDTIQFDYRGHGQSDVNSLEMTIGGEVKDLEGVLDFCSQEYDEIVLLAASFGAVSTCFLPNRYKKSISALCMWNPVLSLRRTFLEPELPWQLKNFGPSNLDVGLNTGCLLIDDSFAIGRKFIEELRSGEPESKLASFQCPVLIIHGDADSYVSYDVAFTAAKNIGPQVRFETISGSEHGFGRPHEEAIVIRLTSDFFASVG